MHNNILVQERVTISNYFITESKITVHLNQVDKIRTTIQR